MTRHGDGGATVLVVSDSHLSPRTPEALRNWSAVVRYARQLDPALVVHAGDLTLDGAHDPGELGEARPLLDQLPAPWVAVPGNHDIGDNPGASDSPVTQRGLDQWRSQIGPDYWRRELGDWTLVGLDAQLFGADLAAANTQWEWLEAELAGLCAHRPVVLVLHKPLSAPDVELARSPGFRFVPAPARHQLEEMLDDCWCPLVISGHVHQFRSLNDDRRQHVWAPTSWAVLPEPAQATVGCKRSGVVSLTLAVDGTSSAELVEPDGLAQLTLSEDLPDPYYQ